MVTIKDIKVETSELINFLVKLKLKQKTIRTTKQLYYSKLSLHSALKYKLFYADFLVHPLVLDIKEVFEPKECITSKEDIKNLVAKVIEFEITQDETFLKTEDRDKIISVFKKLNKSPSKKKTESNGRNKSIRPVTI